MKKFSLLILLVLCVTISGVYATWTYIDKTDVADEAVNMNMNLSDVAYAGTYGTYKVDTSGLTMVIDPKAGTTHTTALYITGKIVISFTPNAVAPVEVKENGVESTFQLTVTPDWNYEGKAIASVVHNTQEEINWTEKDGVFYFEIPAEELSKHITLTEFVLDTKVKYDAYNAILGRGSIVITVSDGQTSSQGR